MIYVATQSGAYSLGLTLGANTALTLPASGTVAVTTNKLSVFAATTSAELAGVISDEEGTGKLVYNNTPTLVTPVIGVATGTSLDLGATTYSSRAMTVDTGGVFNISIGGASGDDFTVDTDKFVVEGDTGYIGINMGTPTHNLHINSNELINNSVTEAQLYIENDYNAGSGHASVVIDKGHDNASAVFGFLSVGVTKWEVGTSGYDTTNKFYIRDTVNNRRTATFELGAPEYTFYLKSSGNIGFGTTTPTAVLHLKAGTATASTAPLKFTAGTLLTTPELGTFEYVDAGTTGYLYFTLNVAGTPTRVQIYP